MRVTSPPAAFTVAAAIAALVLPVTPSSAGAERWQRPVPGEVTRVFDYSPAAPFARGAHRGADLAGAPGEPVRAACGGRIVHAGGVPGGGVAVSLRCGDRRVTHLPLRRALVERGVRIRAGALIGTLAPGHGGGLHLGVRAEADPFRYEDPLALVPPPPSAAPPVAPSPRPPRRIPPPRATRPLRPGSAPRPAPLPSAIRLPRAAPLPPATRLPRAAPLAPALAWAGLAVAALATAGTGAVARQRRLRRRAVPLPAQSNA